MQPGRQRPDRVDPGCPKDERPHVVVVPDQDVEPSVGLATALLCQGTEARARARKCLNSLSRGPLALFAVSLAARPACLAVEQCEFGAKVEVRIVEEQSDRDGSELAL